MTTKLVIMLLCGVLSATALQAQGVQAALSGVATDESGAVVPDVRIEVVDGATGRRREASSDANGRFTIPFLPPSRYTVHARRDGFDHLQLDNVVLNAADQLAITIRLKIAALRERVSVVERADQVSTSPAVSTVVDRTFVENMPLNGRTFQSLIALAPGVAVVPSATSSPGQFSVNGQRTNANYATVDGVSANIGVLMSDPTEFGPMGQEAAGATLGVNAIGGTQNLVTVDSLQEFRLQTSTYSAEFGRQPGGQITLVTRSGTNRLDGTAFVYARHDSFDATDWFINANRLPRAKMRHQQFGGVAGGPVVLPWFGGRRYDGTNRTFFFGSYEGLMLRVPRVTTGSVPPLSLRDEAHPAVRPLIAAYPLPTGPVNPNGRAPVVGSFSDPSNVHAASLKIDQALVNGGRLFARYSDARSSSTIRPFLLLNQSRVNTRTLTVGTTTLVGRAVSNDLRVNFSRNDGPSNIFADDFGGAVPLPYGALGNSEIPIPPTSTFLFDANGNTIVETRGRGYSQRQWNVINTVALVRGRHTLRAGFDYRRLEPRGGKMDYQLRVSFNTPESVRTGRITSGSTSSIRASDLSFDNFSTFVTDTWAVKDRLTLDGGLRWDVNPAPKGSYYTLTGLEQRDTIRVATEGTPLYETRWTNLGPRVGASYLLREHASRQTIIRGGVGLYFDLGAGAGAQVSGFFPFVIGKTIPAGTPFPLDLAAAQPPSSLALQPPFVGQTFIAFAPDYRSPRTGQWSAAVEQGLSRSQTLTVTYVGSAGTSLLRRESIRDPNPLFQGNSTILVTRNNGSSEYHALQLQYRQRLVHGVQTLLNYTFGKSEDTVSSDVELSTRSDIIDPETDRGPSDFDVRHILSGAITIALPALGSSGWPAALTRNWGIDALVRVQSAAPVNVVVQRDLGFGTFRFRPDVVPDKPLYLYDGSFPGGRRVNPAAFVVPAVLRQGNLPRNSVRGFPLRQLDLSLRRDIRMARTTLQFRVDSFNVTNTPNFGRPEPLLGLLVGTTFITVNAFGRSGSMAAAQLGGLNRLYQVGGPRSFQLSMRLSF